ncbi:MAG: ribosome silencing factor [Candidatus Cloacimonadia bacterium]
MEYQINEKTDILCQLAKEKKAEDIVTLNLQGVNVLIDRMIICSGEGTVHTQAIGKYIIEETKKMGMPLHHEEGMANGLWVLLDFGDITVNIFEKKTRNYYSLEELWQEVIQKARDGDSARIDINKKE